MGIFLEIIGGKKRLSVCQHLVIG